MDRSDTHHPDVAVLKLQKSTHKINFIVNFQPLKRKP